MKKERSLWTWVLLAIVFGGLIGTGVLAEDEATDEEEAAPTTEEVLEAIEVGMEIGGGRATVSARFALEAIEDVFGK